MRCGTVLRESTMTRLVRRISDLLTAVAGCALLAMMLLICVDVAGRYFLDRPLGFAIEVVELLMGVVVLLSLAGATLADVHVRVDLITQVVPVLVRRWLDRLASVLLTLFIALATWKLWDKARSLHDDGIFTPILGIPVYPIGFVLAAAGAAAVAAALTVVVVGTKESDAFAQDLE